MAMDSEKTSRGQPNWSEIGSSITPNTERMPKDNVSTSAPAAMIIVVFENLLMIRLASPLPLNVPRKRCQHKAYSGYFHSDFRHSQKT